MCLKYRIKVSEITKEVILCEYSRHPLSEEKSVTVKIKSGRCMKSMDSANITSYTFTYEMLGPKALQKLVHSH